MVAGIVTATLFAATVTADMATAAATCIKSTPAAILGAPDMDTLVAGVPVLMVILAGTADSAPSIPPPSASSEDATDLQF